ncbi:outer membrane protein assembly factor BamB family protein [Streptomyces syringium]|uniref:outer membrane protein assembly factor BamB family protein n=1 Tax=Streptomyces syringium TaxID=76729 RepID=UPI00341EC8DF
MNASATAASSVPRTCASTVHAWADSAYGGELVRWSKSFLGITLHTVPRRKDQDGFAVLAKRWTGAASIPNGQSLVYAGAVHHGHGLQPGGTYVVRRSLNGAVQWQHRTDHPATALDTDGETVYVAYNSGALTALDADDGSVRWHTELEIEGAPTTALSLAITPQGHLLIGTVGGRVLEYLPRP